MLAGLYGLERLRTASASTIRSAAAGGEVDRRRRLGVAARGPGRHARRVEGPVAHLALPRSPAARAAVRAWAEPQADAVRSRVPAGPHVVRAAPADPGRQGHRAGRVGRRLDARWLHRRRRRRPPRLRRARPAVGRRACTPCGSPCAAPRSPPSFSRADIVVDGPLGVRALVPFLADARSRRVVAVATPAAASWSASQSRGRACLGPRDAARRPRPPLVGCRRQRLGPGRRRWPTRRTG